MFFKYLFLCTILLILSCNPFESNKESGLNPPEIAAIPKLNAEQANLLAELPLHCLNLEYPNKLNQTIGGVQDLQPPKALHPAFYGCFDWHSAVHGHWSLVSLLKNFPDLDKTTAIKEKLSLHLTKENILAEVAYFQGVHNRSYERTYGWAWILKLAEELHTWDHPFARKLEENLQPLTDLMVERYIQFLPKLTYPIRSGEHPNTAFGLSFAYDFALATKETALQALIEKRAKDFFMNDANCPIHWEPSGFDFLSPCLEEAALMKRILPLEQFKLWMAEFLPQFKNKNYQIASGLVADREDGKLVHLDGVNFSRAWSLYQISEGLAEYEHLRNVANHHINASLPSVVDDNYAGGHWLGSFAIYALNAVTND